MDTLSGKSLVRFYAAIQARLTANHLTATIPAPSGPRRAMYSAESRR